MPADAPLASPEAHLPDGRLPDAAPDNWVDRHAPRPWRKWLKLGRFDRPAGIWLLMLPGWQGVALAGAMRGRWPDLYLLVAIAVGATVMRAAGCAFNDLVDKDLDRKVARTAARPLASGAISTRGAWAFLVAMSLVGLAILLTLNLPAILLGVASLGLVAAYPFMKRITWWPQAWLGLTFSWGALLGFAAAAGRLTLADGLLYASGIAWTLGYDTIYALQDIEDDALAGVKSSARRLGAGRVRLGVGLFYAASFVLAAGAIALAGTHYAGYLGVVAFGIHLRRQVGRLRADDPKGALQLFRSNREAGLLLFAGLALDALLR